MEKQLSIYAVFGVCHSARSLLGLDLLAQDPGHVLLGLDRADLVAEIHPRL